MDEWDDGYREPTDDEISARRVLALAIALINSRHPLTTVRIRREFYHVLSDEAFRKAFLRDRGRLESAGLVVLRVTTPDGQVAWHIDEDASFADCDRISSEDALVLDCLLVPLAQDPTFPYARDLRIALTKIDRSFDGSSNVRVQPRARIRNNNLTRIEEAMTNGQVIRVSYTRADGSGLNRCLAPYGLFALNGSTYLVAAQVNEVASNHGTTEGNTDSAGNTDSMTKVLTSRKTHNTSSLRNTCNIVGPTHVYNLSRVKSVRVVRSLSYRTPPDFNVEDFIKLPFQIGATQYEATFMVPHERKQEIGARVHGNATWRESQAGLLLFADVSDEQTAATWAIAEGVRPISPASLVDAWRAILQRALEGVS